MAPRSAVLGAGVAIVAGLLAFPALAAAAEIRPQVVLNHLSLVVDEATYRDVTAAPFLAEGFASFSQRSNVSNDGKKWSGAYLYGERTYLELYQPSATQGEPGSSGIALGVERPGDVGRLVLPLAEQTGGEATVVLRTAQGPTGKQIPWFYQLRVFYRSDPPANTTRWVMEYQKDFLRTVEPGKDGIARAQLASRFQEKNRLVKDIVGATVAMGERETDHFLQELHAYGWTVRTEGTTRNVSGPGITLTLIPAIPGIKGLTELRFQLTRKPAQAQSLRFGPKSVLSVRADGTALWTF
jgi:hypothetical protein